MDKGRLVQITWYLEKELAHKEYAECSTAEPRRDDERPPRVNPGVSEQRLRHVVEHQELGDDDHFLGQDQRRQQDDEKEVAQTPAKARETVGRGARGHHGADDRRTRDDDAVEVPLREVHPGDVEDAGVGSERRLRWQELRRK